MTLVSATLAATAASAKAARNWAANLRALAVAQPALVDHVQSLPVHGEWVFARDGSLTLLTAAGQWLGECSLPYRAAVAMLKSLDPRGTVACFLSPTFATEICAAFARLTPQQAVIVLQPSFSTLRSMLACEDFSADLEARRLFFAAGDDWAGELRAIFEQHPGLPTPQQFIKLPTLSGESADPLISGSQDIFAAVLNARAERIRTLRDAPRSPKPLGRLGVIAGSKFALWDDSGAALAEALQPVSPGVELTLLDPDQPALAGPLATAAFCSTCDGLVSADTARCDFPGVLSLDLPWLTWVTRGRIPAFASAGRRDALLLADPAWRKAALDAGWPADRLTIASFAPRNLAAASTEKLFDGWTVLANTVPVQPPKKLDDFSSHQLLWESIADELARDPFAVGDDVYGYLNRRCGQTGIDEAALDRRLFIESLILPSYQQALLRAMLKDKLAVRAFGSGWADLPEFAAVAAGPICNRQEWAAAVASSRRLVHVWPTAHAHPIDAPGLPVLRRKQPRLEAFLQQARRPETVLAAGPASRPLSMGVILSLLACNFEPSTKEPRLY